MLQMAVVRRNQAGHEFFNIIAYIDEPARFCQAVLVAQRSWVYDLTDKYSIPQYQIYR